MFLLSLRKGRQTSKELKRTIVFLMSLLIVFFIKKDSGTGVFLRILQIF